jgi:hypothetical protein
MPRLLPKRLRSTRRRLFLFLLPTLTLTLTLTHHHRMFRAILPNSG